MKKMILLLGVLFVAAGCAPDGKLIKVDVPNKCHGESGRGVSYTPIVYGDSYLAVIEITEVRPGSQWFFRLQPQIQITDPEDANYETAKVVVSADGNTWAEWEKTYAETGGEFYICVPQDESEITTDANGMFKYDVEVVGLGRLDPRGRVMD